MDTGRINKKTILLVLFLLLVLAPLLCAQQDNTLQSLAILEIEGSGVSADFLELIKQSLEEAFYNIEGFHVIEREKITLIIAEQQLQLSGMVNEYTAVQIGELLAADMVVTISVTRFTNLVLTVKFINVKTGEVVFIETHSLKKQADIKPAAEKVARGLEKAVYPSRYLPLRLLTLAGAGMALPVGPINDLVSAGAGGHAAFYFQNLSMNYFDAGIQIDYLYHPGDEDGAAQWFQFVPITVTAGYRFPFAGRFYLRPQIWGGILFGLASIDPDGYVAGLEDPEFSRYSSLYSQLAAGFSAGMEMKALLIELSIKYAVIFGDSEPIMNVPLSLSVGWFL